MTLFFFPLFFFYFFQFKGWVFEFLVINFLGFSLVGHGQSSRMYDGLSSFSLQEMGIYGPPWTLKFRTQVNLNLVASSCDLSMCHSMLFYYITPWPTFLPIWCHFLFFFLYIGLIFSISHFYFVIILH
jgi:hypothetical protein